MAKVGVHVWSPVLRQWFKLCPVQGVGEMSESKQRQFHTPELKAKVGLEAKKWPRLFEQRPEYFKWNLC